MCWFSLIVVYKLNMLCYARALDYVWVQKCVGIVNLIMQRGITGFGGTLLIASEDNDGMEIQMATKIDASDAAYETLEFLVDVCGAEAVLDEFFYYMNVDSRVEFVQDFIRYNDVDTSELNDETLRTIQEHYKRHC